MVFRNVVFLSSNTQDFIEVGSIVVKLYNHGGFLSSNTQDFIEVMPKIYQYVTTTPDIPEL